MESINGSNVLLHDLQGSSNRSQLPPSQSSREKNKRPQLSCNPCRSRKVKCDRIQPCSACSLHQIAELCQYDLSEAERQPILQAEALKEKDRTIANLQEEIACLRGETVKPERDDRNGVSASQKIRLPPRSPRKAQFPGSQVGQFDVPEDEPFNLSESGMTHIADDFDHLSFERRPVNSSRPSLTSDISVLALQTTSSYPFPTLWNASEDTASLTRLLPPEDEIHFYLDSFRHRSVLFSFPRTPDELTEGEVHQFLQNLGHNASLYPDQLALIFAALALGLQDGVFDKFGSKWTAGSVEAECKKGDIYVAAAMQCLRLAAFLSRPTLLVIQTLLMMGPYLTNSGKFLDASALFALTARLAQALDVHCDLGQRNSTMSPKDASARKTLWWWMLYLDQQYSVTLGKPPALPNADGCTSPASVIPDPIWQSITLHIQHFSFLARQILSSTHIPNDTLDRYTDELLMLHKSLPPNVQFDLTWLNRERPFMGWPLDVQGAILHAKTHNLIISLNRRRIDDGHPDAKASSYSTHMISESDIEGIERGRARVLASCRALLNAFEFFHTRLRAGMISWTMGQMAFNASMLLTLSMLETGETHDLLPVQHAYSTFLEMNKLGIHKLAGAAVERLGRLMKEFPTDVSAHETVMGHGGMLLLEASEIHKLVPEGPGCGTAASSSPDMAKGNSTPPQRTRLSQQRRRLAKRATATREGWIPKSRRGSMTKGHRPLADRRFSDSGALRSSHRKRFNRSTPSLSLLTTLSDQGIFSATSTPAVKSETLFTPSTATFEGAQGPLPSPGQSAVQETQQLLTNIAGTQGQDFSMSHHQHCQQQASAFHPQMNHHEHVQHPNSSGGMMNNQTPHQNAQIEAHLQAANAENQNFGFSNTSTPYSSEFFDSNLSSVVVNQTFDDQNLDFEHPPFSNSAPFTMPGEHPSFVAGQF